MKKLKKQTNRSRPLPVLYGLEQAFKDKNGKKTILKDFLTDKDWWEHKGKTYLAVILTHDAVKRIADAGGIMSNPEYTILTQPNYQNNYQYLMQIKICDTKGQCTTEMGESNRSNLSSRGRGNPANMAQKRAYDRAVLRHMGLNGLLGEDELEDVEPIKENMETLTEEEKQAVVPFINKIWASAKKPDLAKVQVEIKNEIKSFSVNQLDFLRKQFKKKVAELSNTF